MHGFLGTAGLGIVHTAVWVAGRRTAGVAVEMRLVAVLCTVAYTVSPAAEETRMTACIASGVVSQVYRPTLDMGFAAVEVEEGMSPKCLFFELVEGPGTIAEEVQRSMPAAVPVVGHMGLAGARSLRYRAHE